MQITGLVLLMAVCVFGAYAMPTADEETTDTLVQMLIAQVRTSLIDTRTLAPGEAFCAKDYNNSTQTISSGLTNATNLCFSNATKMSAQNHQQLNTTSYLIRQNLLTVQEQLANCSALNDLPSFLNCTVSMFDSNLSLLDNANTLAYQVQSEIGPKKMEVDIRTRACIDSAMSAPKTQLMKATNIYNVCLNNIGKHRAMLN